MRLNGDLIFYWIHKKYPKAVHIYGEKPKNSHIVTRPMFWGSAEAMRGHLVVVNGDRTRQIVHQELDAIFLCIGVSAAELERGRNECIALPQDVPTEQVFNLLLEIFDRFAEWRRLLHQAVSALLSYDAIIRSCDQMIEEPLGLNDAQFNYVGYSKRMTIQKGWEDKYVTSHNALPMDVINLFTALPEFKKLEEEKGVFTYVGVEEMLHKNIFDGEKYIGRLSIPIRKDPVVNVYHAQVLLIVAHYVEKLYSRLGTFWHRKTSDSQAKQLLCELMSGVSVDMRAVRDDLKRLGHREGDQYCLIQLRSHFSASNEKLNKVLTAHVEEMWPGSMGLIVDQQFYIFLNLSEFVRKLGRGFKQEMAYFLRESLLVAGVSRRFTDPASLTVAAQQTEIALDLGEHFDPMYWYFNFDDYAFRHLLYKGMQGFPPEQIIAPEIIKLMEYDRQNNTELNLTLKTYLEQSYNAVATAKELCVARSTFLKRLERIQELTKLDMDSFQQRVYLALSYTLLDQFPG